MQKNSGILAIFVLIQINSSILVFTYLLNNSSDLELVQIDTIFMRKRIRVFQCELHQVMRKVVHNHFWW